MGRSEEFIHLILTREEKSKQLLWYFWILTVEGHSKTQTEIMLSESINTLKNITTRAVVCVESSYRWSLPGLSLSIKLKEYQSTAQLWILEDQFLLMGKSTWHWAAFGRLKVCTLLMQCRFQGGGSQVIKWWIFIWMLYVVIMIPESLWKITKWRISFNFSSVNPGFLCWWF